MFDQILQFLGQNPYPMFVVIMVLCGLGLPIPEEITLAAAGYLAYRGTADVYLAAIWCGVGILVGDTIPFVLGHLFGPRILKIRAVRTFVTRRGLGNFDRWFRRQGYKALLVARFLPGMRTAAFFTAGALKLKVHRFLAIDSIGISLVTPLFVWLGYHFGSHIHEVVERIHQAEQWVLWSSLAGALLVGAAWYWRRRRRLLREREAAATETYVQASLPEEPPSNSAT